MKTKYADCDRPLIRLDGETTTVCVLMEAWPVAVDGLSFAVPSDFVTDGASIPRALWRICGHPMEVPRIYAATAHDWLYSGGIPDLTRKQADHAYKQLLRHFGISWIKAQTEYLALRACGGSHWHTQEEEAK